MDSTGWDERYATKDYVWKLAPNQFVEAHFQDMAPGTAIDLAAGEGRNAAWLASKGWDVTAVDFSAVGIEKAERLAAETGVSVLAVVGDALTWVPDGPVDAVVLAYLQLPTPERLAVLERVQDWLKPGGTLFIIAHDRSNIDGGHGGPSEPDVCYEPAETAGALGALTVARAETVERRVDTPDGVAVALDTLIVAHRPG